MPQTIVGATFKRLRRPVLIPTPDVGFPFPVGVRARRRSAQRKLRRRLVGKRPNARRLLGLALPPVIWDPLRSRVTRRTMIGEGRVARAMRGRV